MKYILIDVENVGRSTAEEAESLKPTMTVEELIEKLQGFDKSTKIYLYVNEQDAMLRSINAYDISVEEEEE